MSITLPLPLLKRFLCGTFIETGSFRGDGIQKAIDAGFPVIRSVESTDYYYNECVVRYAKEPRVRIYKGNSGKILSSVISDITSRICFWLDAHSPTETPILEELDQIAAHSINYHTILIDDIKLFGSYVAFKNITLEMIKEKLLKINPKYKIEFVNSLFIKEGILISYVQNSDPL